MEEFASVKLLICSIRPHQQQRREKGEKGKSQLNPKTERGEKI